MKTPLIVISGATASGKTDVAIQLAKKINGEIISADSMQVYKFMNIGTAKPTTEEMDGIKHHLIDVLYPDEEFSIAKFQELAKQCISQIQNSGKVPILCGGTGFYINSIIFDNDFDVADKDEHLREELTNIALEKGNIYLHEMLKDIDVESYENIHYNNVKRVVRVIEFYKITGEKLSTHNKLEKKREKKYNDTFIIINRDRENLYDRINKRVELMVEQGLIKEVESLLAKGYSKDILSMQAIGYKEIVSYINGDMSLEKAVDTIKQLTRHYAKRQLTWFKHQTDGNWIDLDLDLNPIENIINIYNKN